MNRGKRRDAKSLPRARSRWWELLLLLPGFFLTGYGLAKFPDAAPQGASYFREFAHAEDEHHYEQDYEKFADTQMRKHLNLLSLDTLARSLALPVVEQAHTLADAASEIIAHLGG